MLKLTFSINLMAKELILRIIRNGSINRTKRGTLIRKKKLNLSKKTVGILQGIKRSWREIQGESNMAQVIKFLEKLRTILKFKEMILKFEETMA